MEVLLYRNALEPLVAEEVQRQLQNLPSELITYINPAQAIAFALNQLPPLYCTSQRGWELQQRKAQEKLASQIQLAVHRALNAIQLDPLRTANLKFPKQISDSEFQTARQEVQDETALFSDYTFRYTSSEGNVLFHFPIQQPESDRTCDE